MGLFKFLKSSKENVNADSEAQAEQQQPYQGQHYNTYSYQNNKQKLIGYYANVCLNNNDIIKKNNK